MHERSASGNPFKWVIESKPHTNDINGDFIIVYTEEVGRAIRVMQKNYVPNVTKNDVTIVIYKYT